MVSRMGLGLMGMSEFYGTGNDEDSIRVIHKALEIGMNFFDTADMYGSGHNEELLGKAMKGRRDDFIVATKFANVRGPNGEFLGISNKPDYIRKAVDASLKRLGTDIIDLYYMHRKDPEVPIEETVGVMSELVQAGKVKYLGLSEVKGDTLRKGYSVYPITALQEEYSLWTTHIETDSLPVCKELGVSLVAYSPVGRGFLTGKIKDTAGLDEKDSRRNFFPRFNEENMKTNLEIVEVVERIAEEKKATPAQIALSWLLHKGDDVIPIPGTKREKYLIENWEAKDIDLNADDIKVLDSLSEKVSGDRYNVNSIKSTNQ